ncbi:MAG: T9SS type A sorting domain-containing protein, partial [Reichenbachiella sp.]
ADQNGNDTFNAAVQQIQSFTIAKADQAIMITAIEDKLTTTEPFMVSATIDTGLPLTYDVSGPATISETTITLDGTLGVVTVTVSQIGDDNHNAAESKTSFIVTDPAKSEQTVTFTEIADKTYGDADFTIEAIASSSLGVMFSVVSGPITLDGNTVTITGAGEAIIAADQNGDDAFNAAEQQIQSFTIAKADQTISIVAIDDKLTIDGSFDVEASTTSELALTYSIEGPAMINGTTITLDGTVGTVTLTVSQTGNDNYNSVEQAVSFAVTESTITVIENEFIAVKIYPNPAAEWIQIEGRVASKIQVQIFDLRGTMLLNEQLDSGNRLSVQSLSEGIYILNVAEQNHTITTTKLLIRK